MGLLDFLGGSPKIPAYQSIDLNQLQQMAADAARENAYRSVALEESIDPNLARLRQSAFADLTTSPYGTNSQMAEMELRRLLGEGPQTMESAAIEYSPLLARLEEQAMADLEAGGQLPRELANRTVSQSLRRSGASGMRGQGARDLVARDLGLSAFGLEQQRRATAERLGQGQMGFRTQQQGVANAVNQYNAAARQQNQGFRSAIAGQLSGQDQSRRAQQLQTAGLVAGINRPEAGLSPGALASAKVADQNAMNAYNQQKAAAEAQARGAGLGFLGNVLGFGGGFL